MNRKTIMSVPVACFWSVITTCVLGIIIGSFWDFDINVALANKTDLGSFFATYGSYFSYCLYPAAGACLYVGLKKKGDRYRLLAWTLLILGWFMAVYYSNNYNGKAVRALFGYTAGESSAALSALSWLFWAVLYGWVPFVVIRLVDNGNPDKLIAVLLQIIALNVVVYLLAVGSMAVIGEAVPWKTVSLLHLAYFLLQIEIACICFGISAFLWKGGMGIGLGLAIALYFLNIIANLSDKAKVLKYITPFGYAESSDIINNGGIAGDKLLIGLALALAGIGIAYWKYSKKDIR